MLATIAILVLNGDRLPVLQISSSGPAKPWTRNVDRMGENAPSFVCFDKGILVWQNASAECLDPKTGSVRWSRHYPFFDPPASTNVPTLLRFKDLLVVSQPRQGRTYFSAITAIDAATGELRWHKLFETGYFQTEKDGDKLFTYVSADRIQISLTDGSTFEGKSQLSKPGRAGMPVDFPDGRPNWCIPWRGGQLAYYDYEDFPMDLGEMAGVHGLAYLVNKDGKWVDTWEGKWMSRHRGSPRGPATQSIWRVLDHGAKVWVDVEGTDRNFAIVGIDEKGRSTGPILHPSSEIDPQPTSRGILASSEGFLWLVNEGKTQKLRRLLPADAYAQATPFGLLHIETANTRYALTLDPY